ncbi:hypothetical protein QBC45DRAFT_325993, partial [Copromyces sp. CBS 386.78]
PQKGSTCFNIHTAHIRQACAGIRGRVPYKQMTVTAFRFRPDYLEAISDEATRLICGLYARQA